MKDRAAILDYLHAHLDSRRLAHVFGVQEVALHLAKVHGLDPEAADLAALLHDCAKWMTIPQQLAACEQYGIPLSEEDRLQPWVLHAYVGAALAQDLFGVSDAVAQAIRAHTTGWDSMAPLDQLLYVADFCEPNRPYPEVGTVRRLAEEDLREATLTTMRYKLQTLLTQGRPIHPRTVIARNRLLRERHPKEES